MAFDKRTNGEVAEPTVASFLQSLRPPTPHPTTETELASARAAFVQFETAGAPAAEAAEVADHVAPLPDGGRVPIRIIRPPRIREALPAVLFFHGGGWVFGDRDSHDRLMRALAVGAHAAVVYVDFSRSPEARYPAALDEAYGASLWVAEHGAELGIDSTRIAVCGDSAGGNLAAAVALLAAKRGAPAIALQVLFYPVVDADFTRSTYAAFGQGFMLTAAGVSWTWDQYCPDPSRRREPTAAPLNASDAELRGVPPALIIVGEHDVLRDEGEAYARRLMRAGVTVTAVRYLGMIHAFVNLGALAETPSARAAIAQACEALRAAFVVQRPAELGRVAP
jgi:acetyl esterase